VETSDEGVNCELPLTMEGYNSAHSSGHNLAAFKCWRRPLSIHTSDGECDDQRAVSRCRHLLAASRKSDCEKPPFERTFLNQVLQCICCLHQGKGFSYDSLKCSGFEKRDDRIPGFGPRGQRLGEQREAFNVSPFQMRSVTSIVDLRPAEITKRRRASAGRKHCPQSLAQHIATDSRRSQ